MQIEIGCASLTYYIWEGLLVGTVAGGFIHAAAMCGGGGGSTLRVPTGSANNPYMVPFRTRGAPRAADHVHGGPIPLGRYRIAIPRDHPRLGLSARLTPRDGQPMFGRDGFFIHGAGPHGSDGCIVPEDAREFQALMSALQTSLGGTLYVEEATGGERFA